MAPNKLQPYWVYVQSKKREAREGGMAFREADCALEWQVMDAEARRPFVEAANRVRQREKSTSSSTSSHPEPSVQRPAYDDRGTNPNDALDLVAAYLTDSLEQAKARKLMMVGVNLLLDCDFDVEEEKVIPVSFFFCTLTPRVLSPD